MLFHIQNWPERICTGPIFTKPVSTNLVKQKLVTCQNSIIGPHVVDMVATGAAHHGPYHVLLSNGNCLMELGPGVFIAYFYIGQS